MARPKPGCAHIEARDRDDVAAPGNRYEPSAGSNLQSQAPTCTAAQPRWPTSGAVNHPPKMKSQD
jgi:hypothetical protein